VNPRLRWKSVQTRQEVSRTLGAADHVAGADVSVVVAVNDLITIDTCIGFERRGTLTAS
jgi:hypothetical protein